MSNNTNDVMEKILRELQDIKVILQESSLNGEDNKEKK